MCSVSQYYVVSKLQRTMIYKIILCFQEGDTKLIANVLQTHQRTVNPSMLSKIVYATDINKNYRPQGGM